MDIDRQRMIDRVAGKAICRLLSLFYSARKDALAPAKPEKILVILLSEMGSLVLARPMFDRIKEKYPGASIFVLLFQKNKEILDLLGVIQPENILTIRDASLGQILKDSVHVLRTMRKNRIDTVIDCELFSRISSIYSFLSGAGLRVGFHPHTQEGLYRGDFINRPVMYNPYQHISHQFITLVEAIESKGVPKVKRMISDEILNIPKAEFSRDEIKTMSKRLLDDFPQVKGKKIVLINPGGGLLPIRAWPLTYYCQLADDLLRHGHVVGIIGTKQDKEIARSILSHCGSTSCIDLTGYTKTVRELVILFHLTSLLIVNDGGPAHFAAMTPVPTIIFYGPETPALYGSFNARALNCYSHLSCSPCLTAYNHRNSPCDGNNVCLKSISPEMVIEKSHEILASQQGILLNGRE